MKSLRLLLRKPGLFLIYSARTIMKAPLAAIQVFKNRSFERYSPRAFEAYNTRSVQVHAPRAVEKYTPRGFEIFNPREIRIAKLRGFTKGFMAVGGLLLIWILRSYVIAPIAGLMSKFALVM